MNTVESSEEWEPNVPIPVAPMFEWPPKLIGVLRFFVWKQFWPGGVMWIGLAWACWWYATPDLASMANFELGWMVILWSRNAVIVTVFAGSLHWWLYVRQGQGTATKFNRRWPSGSQRFTFGHQTWDNVLWSIASGVTISTGFEAVGWWMFANGHTPYRSFAGDWPYLIVLTVFTFYWSNAHFYANHRALHVGKLYDWAHSVHHRNPNPGPWSGISMHPIEHLLYMSPPVLLWFIPGHPVVHLTLLFFSLLSPILTHAGFERVRLGDSASNRPSFLSGDYFHQLHHRYFECNYGNTLVPFDKLFGTYHDGTPEAHAVMRERQRSADRS